jgi:hypothetical protein
LSLFSKYEHFPLMVGTGSMPGILIKEKIGESLIMNWREENVKRIL